jgi:hypothetical protein
MLKIKFSWRILFLVVIFGIVFFSCDFIDKETNYHHKINITRLFCDSTGNDTFDFYYDEQNKLIMHEWSVIGSGNFNKLEVQYDGNTIKRGEYYYTLDSQNRVIRIVHHEDEWNYEFDGNLLIRKTFNGSGDGDYVVFYQYKNERLVSDSTIQKNYTSITKHHFTETLRPDFMVDETCGLYELKPDSKYLEEWSTTRLYFNGVASITVDSTSCTYQIANNRVECNVSFVQTPKVSNNCMEFQIVYTLEYP